jgi:hypothetical protein
MPPSRDVRKQLLANYDVCWCSLGQLAVGQVYTWNQRELTLGPDWVGRVEQLKDLVTESRSVASYVEIRTSSSCLCIQPPTIELLTCTSLSIHAPPTLPDNVSAVACGQFHSSSWCQVEQLVLRSSRWYCACRGAIASNVEGFHEHELHKSRGWSIGRQSTAFPCAWQTSDVDS